MAYGDAGGPIGPNSLEMFSSETQDYDDFCAGEILVSAIRANAEYSCSGAGGESFAAFGPIVQDTVQQTAELTQANIVSQSSITQETLNALSAPVITDDEISGAPNAVVVGSGGARSAFTPGQLDAAGSKPENWAGTLTIEAASRRVQLIRRAKHQELQRRAQPAAAVPVRGAASLPAAAWGQPAAGGQSWCSGASSPSPWGKLLLFGGLGLIAVGLLGERK